MPEHGAFLRRSPDLGRSGRLVERYQLQGSALNPLALVLATLIFLAISGFLWIWIVFNSLINLHHRIEQAWSQVDVQLKRRCDLIPNLVEAVEGYSGHERERKRSWRN